MQESKISRITDFNTDTRKRSICGCVGNVSHQVRLSCARLCLNLNFNKNITKTIKYGKITWSKDATLLSKLEAHSGSHRAQGKSLCSL